MDSPPYCLHLVTQPTGNIKKESRRGHLDWNRVLPRWLNPFKLRSTSRVILKSISHGERLGPNIRRALTTGIESSSETL